MKRCSPSSDCTKRYFVDITHWFFCSFWIVLFKQNKFTTYTLNVFSTLCRLLALHACSSMHNDFFILWCKEILCKKRKNILLCLDKKTWRCGQRFGGLKPMLRSAAAICAPEPTRNVILRRRHRPRESQRKSSTLWFTILRCYSMITQDEIYHRGSKDTRFFTRSSISRTETVSSTVRLFIIWHVTQSKQIIPSPRAKYKSRAGGCWCTCRAQ